MNRVLLFCTVLLFAYASLAGATALPYFVPPVSGPPDSIAKYVIIAGGSILALLLTVLRLWLTGLRIRLHVTHWLFAAVLVVGGLSLIGSVYRHDSYVALVALLGWCGLYFTAILNIADRRHAIELLRALFVVTVVVSADGLFQFFTGLRTPSYWLGGHFVGLIQTRVYSTLINPDILGGFLVLGTAAAMAVALSADSRFWRWFGLVGMSANLITLLFTYSRGGYIGLAFYLLVSAYLLGPELLRTAKKLWPVLLAVVPALVLTPSLWTRVGGIALQANDTGISRLFTWHTVLRAWRAHLLFGSGVGTINAVFGSFRPYGFLKTYATIAIPGSSHNDYLELLAETGLIGLLILAAVVVYILGRLLVRVRQLQAKDRGLVASLVGGALGLAVVATVDTSYLVIANAVFAALLFAVIPGYLGTREWRVPNRRLAVLPTAGIVLLGIFAASVLTSLWVGSQDAQAAVAALAQHHRHEARILYKEAIAADPGAASYRLSLVSMDLTGAMDPSPVVALGASEASVLNLPKQVSSGPASVQAGEAGAVRAETKWLMASVPLFAGAYEDLAYLDAYQNHPLQAAYYFEQALRHDPYSPYYAENFGRALLLTNHPRAAYQDLGFAAAMYRVEISIYASRHTAAAQQDVATLRSLLHTTEHLQYQAGQHLTVQPSTITQPTFPALPPQKTS